MHLLVYMCVVVCASDPSDVTESSESTGSGTTASDHHVPEGDVSESITHSTLHNAPQRRTFATHNRHPSSVEGKVSVAVSKMCVDWCMSPLSLAYVVAAILSIVLS